MNKQQIDFPAAMIEPYLIKILQPYGIHLQRIGYTIEYHGMRIPFMFDTQKSIANLKPKFQGLIAIIRNELFLQPVAA